MHSQETIQEIGNYESSLDTIACELLQYVSGETKELYYAFSKALQSDLREKFGNVFENFLVAQKTRKEIILETVAFYSEDPSRRAVIKEDGRAKCRYLTEDGRKCAVGRCMIEGKKIAYAGLKFPADKVDAGIGDLEDRDSQLLPEYRGHSLHFWSCLQEFHDADYNFTDTGLSDAGQQTVKYLLDHNADK